jgi:hypothetical protein
MVTGSSRKEPFETKINENAIAYPEAVGELGAMLRLLQDMLKPYGGDVLLDKIIDATYHPFTVDSEGNTVLAVLEAGIKVWYDPQKFHQALLGARRRAESAGEAPLTSDVIS